MAGKSNQKIGESIEITAKDWHQHDRNHFWYLGVAMLIAVGAYLGFYLHDYLMMAVALAVGLAIYRVAHLPNGNRKIRLTNKGVDWGNQFFSHHQLRAFWLAEVDGRAVVYLERLNLAATISFIIQPAEIEPVAKLLGQHLPWHEHKSEPFGERFGRWLKI